MAATAPTPPEGYVWINDIAEELWSKDAMKLVDDLMQEAEERDPDAQDAGKPFPTTGWAMF